MAKKKAKSKKATKAKAKPAKKAKAKAKPAKKKPARRPKPAKPAAPSGNGMASVSPPEPTAVPEPIATDVIDELETEESDESLE
jgi:hypothetical protein